jgi:tungstate transport system substrate-binding protein
VVKIVSVGTGKALAMGQEGNADILLVHAPSSEEEFMEQGYGVEREPVMHNDFIFVGPADDPAGISRLSSPSEVLSAIKDSQNIFVSRGDDSGTHKMELTFWEQTGVTPGGDWYLETGQGMGATLQIASEKGAYTLTDRATFLSLQNGLNLDILVEGDPALLNIYHVLIVNPERWPDINLEGARALADFLVSPGGQDIIAEFGIDKYGQPLFFPDADKVDADFGL